MDWTTLTVIAISAFVLALLIFLILYAFYRIDRVRIDLENKYNSIDARFSGLIKAINSVNYSDYKADLVQDKKIDDLVIRTVL